MTSAVANQVAIDALAGVKEAAAQPNNLSESAVAQSQAVIVHEVAKKVEPIVEHLTNNEPWYQSRVTLGALLTVIAAALGIWGYSFPAEVQGKVIDTVIALSPIIGGLVGAALTLYGRWVARKPIGA